MIYANFGEQKSNENGIFCENRRMISDVTEEKNGALFRVRDVIQIAHQCTMQEREKQPASNAGEKKKEIVTTCSRD